MKPDSAPTPRVYRDYWKRKKLFETGMPPVPVLHWWLQDTLCEAELAFFRELKTARSLLDFGAGDLRLKDRLRKAGYQGEYHTLDVGDEFAHTYHDISEVHRKYEAILLLDVIEHLPVETGLELLEQLAGCLTEGGVLILQTPNARSIRFPMATDMSHIQVYNISDLWAYMTCLGLQVQPFRVAFQKPGSPLRKLNEACKAFVITRWLGCDYADNILLIGRKTGR